MWSRRHRQLHLRRQTEVRTRYTRGRFSSKAFNLSSRLHCSQQLLNELLVLVTTVTVCTEGICQCVALIPHGYDSAIHVLVFDCLYMFSTVIYLNK